MEILTNSCLLYIFFQPAHPACSSQWALLDKSVNTSAELLVEPHQRLEASLESPILLLVAVLKCIATNNSRSISMSAREYEMLKDVGVA